MSANLSYIPHFIIQCLADDQCEGELTPATEKDCFEQLDLIYTCDECGFQINEVDLEKILEDYTCEHFVQCYED